MSKFCTGCGTQIEDSATFCHKCGKAQFGADSDGAAPTDFTAQQRLYALMPPKSLTWHKINIGALVFSIFIALISSVKLMNGDQFSDKQAAYDTTMEAFEGLSGLGVMVAVFIAITAVIRLTNHRSSGIGLQALAFGFFGGANVVHFMGVINYPNIYVDSDPSLAVMGIIYCIGFIIFNHVYYKQRLHMFT